MKKTRRVSKTAKRRLMILIPVTIVALGYFLISLTYYAYKIYKLKAEEKELTEELYFLKEEETNLKTDIEKLKNPDYLARYARENYHYSKEGELVIQREDKKEEVKEEEENNNNTNKGIMALCLFALLLVIIYILKRKPKKR